MHQHEQSCPPHHFPWANPNVVRVTLVCVTCWRTQRLHDAHLEETRDAATDARVLDPQRDARLRRELHNVLVTFVLIQQLLDERHENLQQNTCEVTLHLGVLHLCVRLAAGEFDQPSHVTTPLGWRMREVGEVSHFGQLGQPQSVNGTHGFFVEALAPQVSVADIDSHSEHARCNSIKLLKSKTLRAQNSGLYRWNQRCRACCKHAHWSTHARTHTRTQRHILDLAPPSPWLRNGHGSHSAALTLQPSHVRWKKMSLQLHDADT